MLFSIAAILLLMVLSALTSGTETAVTGASRERIQHLASEGERRAIMVKALLEKRESMIGALLIGNNAFNILAAALATNLLLALTGEAGIAYATLIMTALVVVFAEILPKTYAIRNPERMALFIAPAARVLVAVLGPLTHAAQWIVNHILGLFGVQVGGSPLVSAAEALRGAIQLHAEEGTMQKHARDMLGGILDLDQVTVHEVMAHRRQMVTVDADAPIQEVLDLVTRSPYTRYPVWRGDPDSIIGILHAKDLLAAIHAKGGDIATIDLVELVSAPWFVPDTTPLRHQLLAFRQRRAHLALVVDEYGALMGLITLEDILEEIVGDIADEKDVEVPGVEVQPDGSVLVEGRVTVRDLNRQFDWRLPDDEAATIAGLVIHEAQRIPDVGQSFAFHGFRFEILRRHRHQVTLLRITPPKREEEE
jgi:Mg2+/Co2+ transporter CorB